MRYEIKYLSVVVKKDIPRLNSHKKKIKHIIEQKLRVAPIRYGKPLRHNLKGCRCLRIGYYRVIFIIKNKIVLILCIDHRRKIYDTTVSRFNALASADEE